MGFIVDRETCRSATEQKLRQDPFFGAPDQQPTVTALRERLDVDFRFLLSRISERTTRQKEHFEGALESIRGFFAERHLQMAKGFDQVKATAEPARLRGLSQMFRDSIAALYNPVQYRLKPCLNEVSPKSTVIPGYLSEIERLYEDEARDWPELVRLIYDKSTSASLEGQSILETRLPEITDQCCRSRLAVANAVRRFVLRHRLRFTYRILMVPLKQAFGDYFVASAVRHDRLLMQRWRETASGLEARLDDAWKAVRYNLEVASTELEMLSKDPPAEQKDFLERVEEIEQIVEEALDRGREALQEIREPYNEFLTFFLGRIEHHHAAGTAILDADLKLMGSFKSLLYWNLKRAKKLEQKFLKQAGALVLKALRGARKLGVKAFYEFEDRISDLSSWIGLSSAERTSLLALSELPLRGSVASRLGTLPPIYRRLFSNEPLATREFLVGRNGELDELRGALERWTQRRPSSSILVGQVGTGKTSLINCFLGEVEGGPPFTVREISRRLRNEADVIELFREWFGITEDVGSVSELLTRLKGLPRQGIVVESSHNLMLRTIGGRRAAETFFYLLLSTREDIFWVVTSREWPWAMLNYQIGSRLFFTHEIRTRFHNAGDLESAILIRQKNSGYNLLFLPEGVEDRRLRKLLVTQDFRSEGIQTLLRKKYFDQLFEVTSGNIVAAIYFWLSSLEFDVDSDTIQVRHCSSPDLALIRTLDPVSLYSLAELLNHAYLTVEEHSEIFQLSTAQSRTTLDYLSNVRLVERDESSKGVFYSINPVLLSPVCSILETMNVLY